MGEMDTERFEATLRDCVGRLVGENSFVRTHPVYGVLDRIRRYHGNAFLCGGACRDMLLRGMRTVPRDLDIVVRYTSAADLAEHLGDYVKDRTRFGGFSVEVRDWEVDIWPLSETWAFKHGGAVGRGLDDFTKTTFLDIDAIAVQLFTQKGRKRSVYSHGFFEAIRRKRIEINFEDNPYPAKCVLKSIMLVARHNFAVGPRLARYMEHHLRQTNLDELAEVARIRYATSYLSASIIEGWLKNIQRQLRLGDKERIWLQDAAPGLKSNRQYLI